MRIWYAEEIDIDAIISISKKTIVDHLGIEFISLSDNTLSAKMPVDYRTVQPFRKLHGGASVVLAETMGSMASFLCVDSAKYYCVGQSINANHLKSANEGEWVTGLAEAVHIGRRSHVWQINIQNERNELVCVSRLTMAVLAYK